uniref:UBP-type domain-containing protein n=1 Tax=Echinococcus canadensis TaxID=519352 RepID=A0A915EZP5_9CEST
ILSTNMSAEPEIQYFRNTKLLKYLGPKVSWDFIRFPQSFACHKCNLTMNLWMNLTVGTICCCRRFWDGLCDNNHAIEHYEHTKYPLAVKLGTITPNSAEVFSYAEDDMVTDPLLAQHLAYFGIDM